MRIRISSSTYQLLVIFYDPHPVDVAESIAAKVFMEPVPMSKNSAKNIPFSNIGKLMKQIPLAKYQSFLARKRLSRIVEVDDNEEDELENQKVR